MFKITIFLFIFFNITLFTIIIIIPEFTSLCRSCTANYLDISPKNYIYINKTSKINSALDYVLEKNSSDFFVPRKFIYSLPPDFIDNIDTKEKKKLFIKILLPQVLRINEKILKDREKINVLLSQKKLIKLI